MPKKLRIPYYWHFMRGIHRSPVDSPYEGSVMRSFNIFFVVVNLNKLLKKSRVAGDLRNHVISIFAILRPVFWLPTHRDLPLSLNGIFEYVNTYSYWSHIHSPHWCLNKMTDMLSGLFQMQIHEIVYQYFDSQFFECILCWQIGNTSALVQIKYKDVWTPLLLATQFSVLN